MRTGRCLLAALLLVYAAGVPLGLGLATVEAVRYATLKVFGCGMEGKPGGDQRPRLLNMTTSLVTLPRERARRRPSAEKAK